MTDEYARAFHSMGIGAREATTMAREMMAEAKQEVERRGWLGQSTNTGDLLLFEERRNSDIRQSLEALRREGVRDEDVRSWWNRHPLDRVMAEKSDELNRMTAFIGLLGRGLDGEAAAKEMFRIHPKFGDPSEAEGDDRPLPIELKERIVTFIEGHYGDPERMRAKTRNVTSFNALIRAEMRAGRL